MKIDIKTKHIGYFKGEVMYGNDTAEQAIEYSKDEISSLLEEITELELQLFKKDIEINRLKNRTFLERLFNI